MKHINIEIKPTIELKPCPCCNTEQGWNKVWLINYALQGIGTKWHVQCLTCHLQTNLENTPELAAKIWNKRLYNPQNKTQNTIPNENLVNQLLNIDKFILTSTNIKHYYFNPNGQNENGILCEDLITKENLLEALKAYYSNQTNKHEAILRFWNVWDDIKLQYNYDNKRNSDCFVKTAKYAINTKPIFQSTHFVHDIYHANKPSAFDDFIKILETILTNN